MAFVRACIFAASFGDALGLSLNTGAVETMSLPSNGCDLRVQEDPSKPFLVLRLAHTGSSWITSMISQMNDTYVTREAIFRAIRDYQEGDVRHTASEFSEYMISALKKPSAQMDISKLQMYRYTNHCTIKCLQEQERSGFCYRKYLGLTVDPIAIEAKDQEEAFSAVEKAFPGIPVLVYRRSNIVKHALAAGGLYDNSSVTDWKQSVDVPQFLKLVRDAIDDDNALMKARKYFSNTMLATYEHLQTDALPAMNDVLAFFGMPRDMTQELVDTGIKASSENLRDSMENFDEIETALDAISPCLARQLRSTKIEKFDEACAQI